MKEPDKNILNPGSEEAYTAGCTCPVMDNNYGKGYMCQLGIFVYTENCPLHWDEKLKEIEDCETRICHTCITCGATGSDEIFCLSRGRWGYEDNTVCDPCYANPERRVAPESITAKLVMIE